MQHVAAAAVSAYLSAVRDSLEDDVRRELQSLGSACHGMARSKLSAGTHEVLSALVEG